ncbi:uncharacterized protein EKO05_0000035 [Ascochyta rabiei]|uniref:uncharacterized protein n=1 Tax=Didymella rabiei TaxID=5454 RepID=UPI0019027A9E|nr:uncharacterized protein EKO05_0000035 [Ascochyta rabiei]UPX09344.1 hypothetical protein EKO05_0000035 [Ascochyta rabiei]
MPSFAFWKSSKPDEAKAPLLSDAAVAAELSAIVPGASRGVDLNPGNQDSGVFLFDDDAQEISEDHALDAEPIPLPMTEVLLEEHEQTTTETLVTDESLLDSDEPSPHPETPSLVPEQPLQTGASNVSEHSAAEETAQKPEESQIDSLQLEQHETAVESSKDEESHSPSSSPPVSLVPKELGPNLSVEKRLSPTALVKVETRMRDRDSGVYMSDSESSPARSRPSSIASNDNVLARSRVSSLSKPTAASPQRTNSIARLQRPAELNLGFNSAPDAAKPRSELDLRYDLIRNSKTQSKAALRSPTQLLQDRLNMSPRKKDVEEKVRVFTPPRATANGCMLPGPGAQTEAFTSTSVRARTEAGGRPAWWCKFDKLVVFDGLEQQGSGELGLKTRTSKGLSIARRLGDLETVVIPLDCPHCHEMLNRHEWKYDMRVCKRSVCWDCKERCKWELEQEKTASVYTPHTEANRERADSMLQDEQSRHYGMAKGVAV